MERESKAERDTEGSRQASQRVLVFVSRACQSLDLTFDALYSSWCLYSVFYPPLLLSSVYYLCVFECVRLPLPLRKGTLEACMLSRSYV